MSKASYKGFPDKFKILNGCYKTVIEIKNIPISSV